MRHHDTTRAQALLAEFAEKYSGGVPGPLLLAAMQHAAATEPVRYAQGVQAMADQLAASLSAAVGDARPEDRRHPFGSVVLLHDGTLAALGVWAVDQEGALGYITLGRKASWVYHGSVEAVVGRLPNTRGG